MIDQKREPEQSRAAAGAPSAAPQPSALPPPEASGGSRGRVLRVLLPVALLGALVAGGAWWFLTRNQVGTDDAFVESDIVQVSPRVAGNVVKVHVEDNQRVRQGDPLVDIDPRDFEVRVQQAEATLQAASARHDVARSDLDLVRVTSDAGITQSTGGVDSARSSVAQAQAQLAAADAQRALAQADVDRYRLLFSKDEISRQRLDQAVAAARSAEAQWRAADKAVQTAQAQVHTAQGRLTEARSAPQQVAVKQAQVQTAAAEVEQARAALAQARLDLSRTHVTAPVDGRVTRRSVFPGQFVQAGQGMLAVVYGQPWVTANYKETQLARMHPGQPVKVRVDALPGREFQAVVDSFQPGTGSRFSMLPPENATGNYVKVVQRVPVKIVFTPGSAGLELLAPGMSVQPEVDVSGPGVAPARSDK